MEDFRSSMRVFKLSLVTKTFHYPSMYGYMNWKTEETLFTCNVSFSFCYILQADDMM